MAKFPGIEDAPQPGSLRPSYGIVQDRSYENIARGAQDLAQGLGQLGEAAYGVEMQHRKEQNAADIAAAEAVWLKGTLDLGNEYDNRTDYEEFGDASSRLDDLREEAAALIRDPQMRESWSGDANLKALVVADGINDRANSLRKNDSITRLEGSLETNASILSDPTAPEETRTQALIDMQGALIRSLDIGLLTNDQADALKKKYIDTAEEDLAVNRGLLEIKVDPSRVMTETGIPAAMSGTEVGPAALSVGGADLIENIELASVIARELGDNAFPTDPELQKAYLADPEIAARYTTEAVDYLTTKFKGDTAAAIIAIAPEGSEQLARVWLKGGKDDALLPPSVRTFYRETLKQVRGPATVVHIPAEAAPGIEISDIDTELLARFEQAQSQFGSKLLITGGKRATLARGEEGMDVSMEGLKEEDRARLVETLSAMGFTGMGIKGDTLHLDMGKRRFESDDAKLEEVGKKHTSGEIVELPITFGDVDPKYANLPFDKRLKLYEAAEAETKARAVDMRGAIEVAVSNAPVAIMNTGAYDGTVPDAKAFVEAYGAAEGVERYKAFQSTMEVAESAWDFRTMSLEDIADTVDAARPTSSGDGAFYEQKRFDALSEAAAAIKKARDADPSGYVLQTFPNVATLMEDFGKSPEQTQAALAAMDAAQTSLGITDKQLVPKTVVEQTLATFNNEQLPADERMSGVMGTLFATQDEDQRRAILAQYQKAGLPQYSSMVFEAFDRGDEAGGKYLLRAMMVDPKADLNLPVKPSEIDEAIAGIFERGGIGNAYYGLTGAYTDQNLRRATDDAVLLKNDIKLRLLDGSAANLDQAVALASKDMFGTDRVLAGAGTSANAGMMVTVPAETNDGEMRIGFTQLMPQIADALRQSTDPVISKSPTPGAAAHATFVRDTDIRTILREGYFANAGPGQYQFLDPDGIPVTDPQTGKPMVFSIDDVTAAARTADQGQLAYQRYLAITGGNERTGSTAERYYDNIGGRKPLTRDPFK